MYEIFEALLRERGVTASDVSKATGIARSNFSDWKMGRTTPKLNKLKLIANYFEVPLETFTGDSPTVASPKRPLQSKLDKKAIAKKVLETLEDSLPEEPEGYPVYYINEETARAAQEVFDNPDTRMLFDAARDASPEDIRLAAEMLRRFKKTNPNG